jgi:SAM-dependent methyltransferase
MSGIRIFTPDYYARMRELESLSWWNAGMRDNAERMLRQAGLPATGVMLDIGCGSGQTMRWFREAWPGWRTVGLDVARDGLHAARDAGEVEVLGGSALDLPVGDGTADAIVTLDVLQHLPLEGGDRQALREMHRALRPGGILFIRTNAQSWPRADDDRAYNFHKYTAGELRSKLEEAGFRVIRLGQLNAVLGLAEIPRDLRARKASRSTGYIGLLARPPRRNLAWHAKRGWLRLEGALVAAGASLPLGRSLLAVAQARTGGSG